MKNFGADDAGIFNVIPKDIRKMTSGLVSAVADPLNVVVDQLQGNANNLLKEFPQVQVLA